MIFDNFTKITSLLSNLDNNKQLMTDQLISLAEINSGSFNVNGVNKVVDKLSYLFKPLGGEQQVIELDPYKIIDKNGHKISRPIGNALTISKRADAPFQVFLCAHLDTVFPEDSHFQSVKWLDEDTLNGPGVADLKGGIIIMLHALQTLENSPLKDYIGWQVLFNPDEEIGSLSSNKLLKQAAKRANVGMIYEPSFPNGDLAGQRKGSGNFTILCHGKSAHAGRELELGRNAILATNKLALAIDKLNNLDGISANVANINADFPLNIVPDFCYLAFNVRVETTENMSLVTEKLNQIIEATTTEGISFELQGGFTRPPKVLSAGNKKLLDLVKKIGSSLGLNFNITATGGCCDGNNIASYGVPNIDSLGVHGGNIHTDKEYAHISSLVPRAKMSAGLLLAFAYSIKHKHNLDWLHKDT
jgi:glutamate carboxypeptidase